MAKEKKETLERIVTVSLKKDWIKVPRNERGKKAVRSLRENISRYMKAQNIRISQNLNERLWFGGANKPPSKIRIKAEIDGDLLTARLPEEISPQKEKEKMNKLKKSMGKILPKKDDTEKVGTEAKPESPKDTSKSEPKAEEAKTEEKTESDTKTEPKVEEKSKTEETKEVRPSEQTEKKDDASEKKEKIGTESEPEKPEGEKESDSVKSKKGK